MEHLSELLTRNLDAKWDIPEDEHIDIATRDEELDGFIGRGEIAEFVDIASMTDRLHEPDAISEYGIDMETVSLHAREELARILIDRRGLARPRCKRIGREESAGSVAIGHNGGMDVSVEALDAVASLVECDLGRTGFFPRAMTLELRLDSRELILHLCVLVLLIRHIAPEDGEIRDEKILHLRLFSDRNEILVHEIEEYLVDVGAFHIRIAGDDGCWLCAELVEREVDLGLFL